MTARRIDQETAVDGSQSVDPPVVPPMPPTNVIAALAAVQREIGGIGKMTPAQRAARSGQTRDPNERGVNYAYRGVDDIASKCQPLFGEYGIVIVPNVTASAVESITVGGKDNWTETTIHVEWQIFGPGGVSDVITACTHGVGRDNSDKGMNKATTSAYKNLLLRLLTIGDPQDDPDAEKHETDTKRTDPEPDRRDEWAAARGWSSASEFRERWAAAGERARKMSHHATEIADAWRDGGFKSSEERPLAPEDMKRWEAILSEFESLPDPGTPAKSSSPVDGDPF